MKKIPLLCVNEMELFRLTLIEAFFILRGNELQRRTKLWIEVTTIVLISYIMLMMSSDINLINITDTLFMDGKRVKIFTFIMLMLLFWCLMAIIRSFWMTTAFFTTINAVISVTNFEKVKYRNEGILPTDLSMISSLNKILGMVGFKVILSFCLLIIVIFLSSYYLLRKNKIQFKLGWSLGTVILTALVILSLININQNKSVFYKSGNIIATVINDDPMYYDAKGAVTKNGPILNFINNLNVKVMDKPDGYSKQKILKIESKYKKISRKMNQTRNNTKQHVIFVLSESFSDPTQVPGIELNHDPIPYTRSLMKNNVGGNMISDGYGGGTANMEYQALTGLSLGNFSATLPTPYTQLVVHQKKVYSVNQYYQNNIAVHPYLGDLYDRNRVFKKMKFDNFNYLGHLYPKKYSHNLGTGPYISDMSAYKYVLSNLNDKNENQFIQLSTMQNHMPYDKKYYQNNQFKVSGNISNDEKNQIVNYAKGINYTDKANKYLIDHLKNMKSNVTVVFYGDHLPGIYSHVDMNKHGIKMHETPYFIWSNHKLKKIPYSDTVGTYGFASEMMQATNTKVSPYYALIQKVNQSLPIIASKVSVTAADPNLPDGGMNLVDTKNKKFVEIKDLSKQQEEILSDYQNIQYDLTTGKGYINNSFMEQSH